MASKRPAWSLGSCRMALRPQPDEIATCKPQAQSGLRPNFKRRGKWPCRNPLQRERRGFGTQGLAAVGGNPPRHHKWMKSLELGGVPGNCDGSITLRELVAPQVHLPLAPSRPAARRDPGG